ncbi:MAG TPA: DUF4397 domain-containing protein [Flavisolibacter sp.]|nr:DUF4397 domain-containing protein [Flavisolibacter sp.]
MRNSIYLFTLLIAGLLLASCDRDKDIKVPENDELQVGGNLKVYDGVVTAARNYVYVNNKPVTGAALALGGVFPSTNYSAVPIGSASITVKDTLATTTQFPANVGITVKSGRYYSLFVWDTLNAVKTKIVEDTITVPLDTVARIRFANIISSKTAIPNVDIFSTNLNRNIFTNIAVGDVTGFINHPSKKSDVFAVRSTGTTTNLATLTFTPDQKRSYTLFFRGRYQSAPPASGTAPAITRTLSVTTNR